MSIRIIKRIQMRKRMTPTLRLTMTIRTMLGHKITIAFVCCAFCLGSIAAFINCKMASLRSYIPILLNCLFVSFSVAFVVLLLELH